MLSAQSRLALKACWVGKNHGLNLDLRVVSLVTTAMCLSSKEEREVLFKHKSNQERAERWGGVVMRRDDFREKSIEWRRLNEWYVGAGSGIRSKDSIVMMGKWSEGERWVVDRDGASERLVDPITRSRIWFLSSSSSTTVDAARMPLCPHLLQFVLLLCVCASAWVTRVLYGSEFCVFSPYLSVSRTLYCADCLTDISWLASVSFVEESDM